MLGLGFRRKVGGLGGGIYVRPVSEGQDYWVAAFADRGLVDARVGFLWPAVNRLVDATLRAAVSPDAYQPQFSPDVGPALYMCSLPGSPTGRFADAASFEASVAAFLAGGHAPATLGEAVARAVKPEHWQPSHSHLVPAALALLGRQDEVVGLAERFLAAMPPGPVRADHEAYYARLLAS